MNVQTAFHEYAKFLENLTVESVSNLSGYVSDNVLFSDPFHEVKGAPQMAQILVQMFEKVSNISFKINSSAANGNIVYFNWVLNGTLSKKSWVIEGVTQLKFDEKMKIESHVEYWDAASQFYERFPIFGPMLRYFRHRIAGS